MHLVFDIFQGLGVAAAIGVRPFLPALVTGALAAGDVELSFHRTKVHFLQQPVFLLIMVVAIVLLVLAERRLAGRQGAGRRSPSCSRSAPSCSARSSAAGRSPTTTITTMPCCGSGS